MERNKNDTPKVRERMNGRYKSKPNSSNSHGMERITVPLRGMKDVIIYFPKNMDVKVVRRVIKTTSLILHQFYGIDP